jgi:hypothetical protein
LPCATRVATAGPPRRRAGARRRTRRSSRRAGRQVLLVFDERVDVPASRLDLVRGSARDQVDPERAAAVLAAGRPSLKREGCPKRLEGGGATCGHTPCLQRGFEVSTRARARSLSVLLFSFSGSAHGVGSWWAAWRAESPKALQFLVHAKVGVNDAAGITRMALGEGFLEAYLVPATPSAERLSPSPGRRLREPRPRRRVALPGPGGVPDGPGAGPRTTNDRFSARHGGGAVRARGQVHPLRAPGAYGAPTPSGPSQVSPKPWKTMAME